MRALVKTIRRLGRNTKAATAIEYGLICAMIVIAIMVSLMAVGTATSEMWNNVSNKVQTAK